MHKRIRKMHLLNLVCVCDYVSEIAVDKAAINKKIIIKTRSGGGEHENN